MSPLDWVGHVDVYWRLTLWIHSLLVFPITHLSSLIEMAFVNGLTQVVLEFTSFLLPFNGYPIEISGSSFIVDGEILDVAEGCSGIRSFQSCIVAALALGEFNRSSISRRLILLLLSLGLAVVLNSLRVFTLVRIAHKSCLQEMNTTHDTVGFWTMIATFSSITLVAWLLARSQNTRSKAMAPSKKETNPSSQKA